MELKFVEEYNEKIKEASSNRTFMELKYDIHHYYRKQNPVLIVPLWN